jgi:hypothetical protein
MKYGIFEHYGCSNEELITEWNNYDDAWCAMHEFYTDSEREELGVEIAKWDGEHWTMEY